MAKKKNVKKGSSGKGGIEDKLQAEEILQSFKGGEAALKKKRANLLTQRKTITDCAASS